MIYKIIIPTSVEKVLNKLPLQITESIIKQLEILQTNPYPRNSKKLINREGWRIRVNTYRIIYDINSKLKEVYIRKIAHRKDIYR